MNDELIGSPDDWKDATALYGKKVSVEKTNDVCKEMVRLGCATYLGEIWNGEYSEPEYKFTKDGLKKYADIKGLVWKKDPFNIGV